MKQQHLSILLEKFENGTCTDAELAELNAWYHSFSDHESALEDDLTVHPELLKTLKFQLWNGIEQQVVFPGRASEQIKRPVSIISHWLMRIAAVLAIGLSVTLLFYRFSAKQTISEFHTISTEKGNLSKVKLSDGTAIWVKSGSVLRYPEVFGINSREVFLEGEAFFDVAHQEDKPFLVHTSDLTIRVLGTAFNVKSYKDQGTIETTLVRGQVKIENEKTAGKDEIILNPNERAVYNKESGLLNVLKSIDVADVEIREPENESVAAPLVFDETPFTKVFAQMEQRFHVKIHIADKENLDCKLTADLQKEGLADIMQLLEVSHQIHFRISGNEVYITGKLCH